MHLSRNYIAIKGPGDFDPPEPDGISDCDTCGGTGKVDDTTEYANGLSAMPIDCPDCDGAGHFDEAGVAVRLNCWGDRDYGMGFAQ